MSKKIIFLILLILKISIFHSNRQDEFISNKHPRNYLSSKNLNIVQNSNKMDENPIEEFFDEIKYSEYQYKAIKNSLEELLMIFNSFLDLCNLIFNVIIQLIYLLFNLLRIPYIIIKLLYNLGFFNFIFNKIFKYLIGIKNIPYLYIIRTILSLGYFIFDILLFIFLKIFSMLNPFYLINVLRIEIFYFDIN
jgi:hypothetical protein